VTTRGHFTTRLLLAATGLFLLSVSLPDDAHAKKRRGGAPKIDRRGDKAPPAAERAPKPPAPADSDDAAASVGARERSERSGDEDSGNDAGEDAAVVDGGDADRDTESERPRRRRARLKETADADVSATAEPAETGSAGRWLELAAGARGFSRSLTYNDQVTSGLRQYQLALGPAVVVDVAFYPLALAVTGPAANIGLVAEIEQAVATSSQLATDSTFPNGATFPTSMHQFAGGIRYRIPIGASQIGAAAGFGEHAFWFTGAERDQLDIPNMIYRFVRAGLDARLAVTPDFSIGAGAGYRHVLNQGGPIRTDFPHLTVAGVDVDVRAAYAFTRTIEARLQADLRRYFYDMRSIRGDARIAGGAVDQYLSVAVLLALTLDRNP
jgi:hypothetical protein